MQRGRLIVGAVVVALAVLAGADLAGLGPGPDDGGPGDVHATESPTEPGPTGTPGPATPQERPTPARPAGGGSSGEPDRRQTTDTEPATASGPTSAGGDASTPMPTSPPTVETPPPDPFEVRIDRIEPCGQFCRDITASLTNRQATPATNVVVATRLYPGNRTDGQPVWTGQVPVGTLGPGATTTTNTRVELSLFDAFAISDADGWVTVSTTIRSDERTVTVTEQRQVT